MPRMSKRKKFFLNLFFHIIALGGILSYSFVFYNVLLIFLFGNIYSFDMVFNLFLSICGFILIYIYLIRYRNRFWAMFSVILCSVCVLISYLFLSSLIPAEFPTRFASFQADEIYVEMNMINIHNVPFSTRGHKLCFNGTYTSKYNERVFFDVSKKVTNPNGEDTPEFPEYEDPSYINPNSSITRKDDCVILRDVGLNLVSIRLRIYNATNANVISNPDGFGYYIFVYSEREYFERIDRRYLSFFISLAIIPIILSSVKIFRDLYNDYHD